MTNSQRGTQEISAELYDSMPNFGYLNIAHKEAWVAKIKQALDAERAVIAERDELIKMQQQTWETREGMRLSQIQSLQLTIKKMAEALQEISSTPPTAIGSGDRLVAIAKEALLLDGVKEITKE